MLVVAVTQFPKRTERRALLGLSVTIRAAECSALHTWSLPNISCRIKTAVYYLTMVRMLGR